MDRPKVVPKEITFDGRTMTLEEWSQETGIHQGTIRSRWAAGWELEDILTRPTIISTRKILRDKAFKFIVRYKKNNDGNSPTMREIAKACDTTTSNIKSVVDQLVERKRISIEPNQPRTIEVVGSRWIPPE